MKRYLLGAFVVVQLAFLFVANIGSVALYFSTTGSPAAIAIWRAASTFSEPWAHLTGQEQYWRMFAPAVPLRAMFVRLRVHFGGDVVPIPSEFEPLPGQSLLHLPGCGERIWHVEKSLALPFVPYEPVETARRPDEWRTYVRNAIGANRHRYRAFIEWKFRRQTETRSDPGPIDRIDLLVSIHTPSRHDRIGEPEYELLVLKWRPDREDGVEIVADTPNDRKRPQDE